METLASEKKPKEEIHLDWRISQERAVFNLKDTTPNGIRYRFVINEALRNTRSGRTVKFTVRPHVDPHLSIDGQSEVVLREDMETFRINSMNGYSDLIEKEKHYVSLLEDIRSTPRPGSPLQKGPRVIDISTIQSEQTAQKDLKSLRQILARIKTEIRYAEQSLNYVGPLKPETASDAVKGHSRVATRTSRLVPLPRLVPGVQGYSLSFTSASEVWGEDIRKHLLEQFVFATQMSRPITLLIYAPPKALSEEGAVLPLDKDVEDRLTAFVTRSGKTAAPFDSDRAWQWLIISHNASGLPKVKLPNKLSVSFPNAGYFRRNRGEVALLEQIRLQKQALEAQAVQLEKLGAKVSVEGTAALVEMIQSTVETRTLPDVSAEFPTELTFQGVKYKRMTDPDFYLQDVNVITSTMVLRSGEDTAVYSSFGVTILEWDPLRGVVESLKVVTTKGVTPVSSSLPQENPKVEKKVKSPKKKSSSAPAPNIEAGKKKEEKPPVALRVKGLPRSSDLTDGQRESLRRHFKIDVASKLSDSEWTALDKVSKTAHRLSMSIPRWAASAVKQDPNNLGRIIAGTLTKENFHGFKPATLVEGQKGVSSQSEASKAWVAVKGRFPDVRLLESPFTKQEKKFKAQYEALISEFGQQKCFPKPRKAAPSENQKKRSAASSPAGGGFLEKLTKFVSML
jgi:hypothetical protein